MGLRRAVSADNSCHDLVGSSVRFAGLGRDATDGEFIGDARQTRGILAAARGVRGGAVGAGGIHGVIMARGTFGLFEKQAGGEMSAYTPRGMK